MVIEQFLCVFSPFKGTNIRKQHPLASTESGLCDFSTNRSISCPDLARKKQTTTITANYRPGSFDEANKSLGNARQTFEPNLITPVFGSPSPFEIRLALIYVLPTYTNVREKPSKRFGPYGKCRIYLFFNFVFIAFTRNIDKSVLRDS